MRERNRFIAARLALAAALVLAPAAGATLAQPEGDPPASGPVVAVPYCKVLSQGCSIDPATPDLNPAACATEIALHLERREVATRLVGGTTVLCAPGSGMLVAEGTLTAICPARAADESPLDQLKTARLLLEVEVRDCASGIVVGRAETKRSLESGRRTLVRDLVEELGHHISERKIRNQHPDTPVRWMKASIGGERAFEVLGGVVDIKSREINDLFAGGGLEEEDYAYRVALGFTYRPWIAEDFLLALNFEALTISVKEEGDFDAALLGLASDRDGAGNPIPGVSDFSGTDALFKADLRTVGITGTVGYGFDFTRNQRVSGAFSFGYYILGAPFAPARIEVEGLPAGTIDLRDATLGGHVEVRYEWRLTPHLALVAEYGWHQVEFRRPNRLDADRHFVYDVEFTGGTARGGIAFRY